MNKIQNTNESRINYASLGKNFVTIAGVFNLIPHEEIDNYDSEAVLC
jgi:hypothetical protein